MARSDQDMRMQLCAIGIVSIGDQDRVIDVARKCAATGVAVGAGWAVLGAPALGPGVMAGFLSGFITGTATCMGLSYSAREVIKKLSSGDLSAP